MAERPTRFKENKMDPMLISPSWWPQSSRQHDTVVEGFALRLKADTWGRWQTTSGQMLTRTWSVSGWYRRLGCSISYASPGPLPFHPSCLKKRGSSCRLVMKPLRERDLRCHCLSHLPLRPNRFISYHHWAPPNPWAIGYVIHIAHTFKFCNQQYIFCR